MADNELMRAERAGWLKEYYAKPENALAALASYRARLERLEKAITQIAGTGSDGKKCWCYAGRNNTEHDAGCVSMREEALEFEMDMGPRELCQALNCKSPTYRIFTWPDGKESRNCALHYQAGQWAVDAWRQAQAEKQDEAGLELG